MTAFLEEILKKIIAEESRPTIEFKYNENTSTLTTGYGSGDEFDEGADDRDSDDNDDLDDSMTEFDASFNAQTKSIFDKMWVEK